MSTIYHQKSIKTNVNWKTNVREKPPKTQINALHYTQIMQNLQYAQEVLRKLKKKVLKMSNIWARKNFLLTNNNQKFKKALKMKSSGKIPNNNQSRVLLVSPGFLLLTSALTNNERILMFFMCRGFLKLKLNQKKISEADATGLVKRRKRRKMIRNIYETCPLSNNAKAKIMLIFFWNKKKFGKNPTLPKMPVIEPLRKLSVVLCDIVVFLFFIVYIDESDRISRIFIHTCFG